MGVLEKIPSVREVWIFSGITQLEVRVRITCRDPQINTGSPHIRLEQTNFIGRVLCRLLRARNARSVSARSGTEITKSLGACSEI